jgi:hypothetical protein
MPPARPPAGPGTFTCIDPDGLGAVCGAGLAWGAGLGAVCGVRLAWGAGLGAVCGACLGGEGAFFFLSSP